MEIKNRDKINQLLCNVYAALMFIVMPLLQHNGYYESDLYKYYFYVGVTLLFTMIILYQQRYTLINRIKDNAKSKSITAIAAKSKALLMDLPIFEKLIIVYLLITTLSCILGLDFSIGFWGSDRWYMGLFMQYLMCVSLFVFARLWKPVIWPIYFAMLGSSIVFILGILMRFGIDPLGNYIGVSEFDRMWFVSTIGQTSWYSGYMCTIFPIGVGLFYLSKNKKDRIISFLYCVISFCALIIQDSDAVFIAAGATVLVLLWCASDSIEGLYTFLQLISTMLGCFVVMGIIRRSFIKYYTGDADSLSVKISENKAILIGFVILLIALLVLKAYGKDILERVYRDTKILSNIRKLLYAVICAAVLLFILAIPLNTFGIIEAFCGKRINNSYFIFNEWWGNRRGVIWIICVQVMKDMPLWRKFIGIGPDCLSIVTKYDPWCQGILTELFGEAVEVSNAHNEFLNAFIAEGLAGGIAYAGFWISCMIKYAKSRTARPEVLIGLLCIASYCGHNIVSYQTIVCTPFIFIIIGMCQACIKSEKDVNLK